MTPLPTADRAADRWSNARRVRRAAIAWLPIFLLAGMATQVLGATRTWSGASAGSSFWSDPANWVGSVAPATGDSLVFPASAARLNNVNDYAAGTVLGSITFTGAGYALSGANTLALTNGISAKNATLANQIGFPLQLNAAQIFATTAAANSLSFNGSISLNGFDLTFNVLGALNASGGITGTGNVNKTGSGSLTLSGANAFGGITTVQAGTLFVQHPQALGASGSGTVVISGAQLDISGVSVANESLALNDGAILSVVATGSGTWSGPIVLNGTVNFQAQSGHSLTCSGVISGPGGLTLNGGTIYLIGGSGNSYLGTTLVASGTVMLNKSIGTSIPSGPLIIGDGVGGPGTAVVREANSSDLGSMVPITINRSGLLDLNGFSDVCGALTLNGGGVTTGSGNLSLNGNLLVNGSPTSQSYFSGNLHLTLTPAIDVETVTNALVPEFLLNASISGNFGFNKSGLGTLSLAGLNSFTGPVQVNTGTLAVNHPLALGATNSGTTVSSNAILQVNAAVPAEPLTLNDGAILSVATNVTGGSWGGTIVLNGTAAITPGVGQSFTSSGVISGSGGLTLRGGTNYLFGGSGNTYAGTTWVASGTVILNKSVGTAIPSGPLIIGDGVGGPGTAVVREANSSDIGSTVPITINRSGLLDLTGFSDVCGALTLNGGGVTTGSGNLSLSGNLLVNGSPTSQSYFSGNLHLTLTPTIDVETVANALVPEFLLNASINGNFGLTKTGLGMLSLAGLSTFTGPVQVNAGTLAVNHPLALGATNSGTTVSSNAILQVNATVPAEPLTLNDGAIVTVSTSVTGGSWGGTIVLNGTAALTPGVGQSFTCSGLISGSGGLTLRGGTNYLFGGSGNTYAGTTWVASGTVIMNKTVGTAIPSGPLIIGDGVGGPGTAVVREANSSDIGATVPININHSGLLDLTGFMDLCGSLTLNGGGITTGSGALSPGGGILVNGSTNSQSFISGNLNLPTSPTIDVETVSNALIPELNLNATTKGAHGLTKTGPGTLLLGGTNNFTGPVQVNAGTLVLANSTALGTTNFGTTVNGTAILQLNGVSVTNIALSLNGNHNHGLLGPGTLTASGGSNAWSGPITLVVDTSIFVQNSNDVLNLTGSIGGSGGFDQWGLGTLILSGPTPNTYTNLTRTMTGSLLLAKTVPNAAILGPLSLSVGAPPGIAASAQMTGLFQFGPVAPLTVGVGGRFDFNGFSGNMGSLNGAGSVYLEGATLGVGNDQADSAFSGGLFGSGGLDKFGAGRMRLAAGSLIQIPALTVWNGTLAMDATAPTTAVYTKVNGVLSGSGTVGNLTIDTGGVVQPGDLTKRGTLTVNGNLGANSAGSYDFTLNGPVPQFNFGNLLVHGTTHLEGRLSIGLGFLPTGGQPIDLIRNSTPVSGTFAGLPEGAITNLSGLPFQISYVGGPGGHDVTLTEVNLGASVAGLSYPGVRGATNLAPNDCHDLYLSVSNSSGAPLTNLFASLTTSSSGVAITQPYSVYPTIPAGGFGTNLTPFQISLLPSFLCGQTVRYQLTLSNATFGPMEIFSATAPGGQSNGAPVEFANHNAATLPDVGTTDIPILVTNFSGMVSAVTVALFVTHPFDQDLSFYLIAPNGTTVRLAGNDGSSGHDFGTFCGTSQRTTFSDSAILSIDNGQAPFTNTYRPQQPLAAFSGMSPAAANGLWTLRIVDGFPGSVGVFRCAALFLSSEVCGTGSGACLLCPNTIIAGALDPLSPTQTTLTRVGTNSICGSLPLCPGPGESNQYYQVHTFQNGPQDACITVTLQSSAADVFSAAYAPNFSPTAVCSGLIGFSGDSTLSGFLTNAPFTRTYSFNVTSNEVFDVTVNGVGGSYGPYQLSVTGGSCAPSLRITSASSSRVELDWPTSAPGYRLEFNSGLAASKWTTVTNQPTIFAGQYSVTNAATGSARFFRLSKP